MRLAVVAVAAVFASLCTAQTDTALASLFTKLGASAGVTGMAVTTLDTTGPLPPSSGSFGLQDVANGRPMWPDTAVRGNSVGETLVVLAALKLIDSTHLPALDSTIPASLLPQSISIVNPGTPSAPVTLRMLMAHTSTLTDSTKFGTYARTAPTSVIDLRSFVQAFLLVSSGGAFSLATDIFTTDSPGSDAAFLYARINIATLTYIVESAVIATPTLVASSSKTALAYIQEAILAPLGMATSPVAGLTGALPLTTYPAGAPVYSGNAAVTRTENGAATTAVPLHPAYLAEDMLLTTAPDLARLAHSLFLGGANAAYGDAMAAAPIAVSTGQFGQTLQGLGIRFFDGATVCDATLAAGAVTKCPLTSASYTWGYVADGEFSQVAVLCTTDAPKLTCTTAALVFDRASTAKGSSLALSAAGTALQMAVGDTSSVTLPTDSDRNDVQFGIGIAFATLGTLVFIVIAAFLTEIIIQPAPAAAAVTVPGMAPPPKLEG